jgi:hypothetical protein
MFISAIARIGAITACLVTSTMGLNYEFSNKSAKLSDNNFLIRAFANSSGKSETQCCLLKVGPAGDTLWSKTFGATSFDAATDACELADGNILVAGAAKSSAADASKACFDVWLFKINASGNTLWTKTFPGGNTGDARIILDARGNIFIAASSTQADSKGDVQIIKCDKSGNRLWTKTYGKAGYEFVSAFRKTSDGSMLLLTTSQSFGAKTMRLFKLNGAGDTLWSRTYNSFDYGNASDIIEMPNGSYMMSGYAGSSDQMPLVVYNIATNGVVNWQKTYPEFSSDVTPTFRLLPTGNLVISSIEGNKTRVINMKNTGEVLSTELRDN